MTTFERVQELCRKHGVTIVQLEEKVGFGRNSMYSWKKNKPSTERLEKVADFFNVSTDYLLGRTDEKEIQTIAAHHDGEDWSEEELKTIEEFKKFVKSQRENRE